MTFASVAVVTRTKNRPLLLKRAIASLLAQTYSDWNLVVVNDGGDPAAVEGVCHAFGSQLDGKLVIVHNTTSVGVEEAGNIGILASESEYLTQLDDDDTYHPEFLQACVEHMRDETKPDLGGVITHWREIWEKIESDEVIKVSERIHSRLQFISLYEMSFRYPFVPACFLYRRSAWERVGRFNASLPLAGDWDFALRLLSEYEIGVVPKVLANYHRRTTSHYNNSVQSQPAILDQGASRIRNAFLRKDLQEGCCGLGVLMSMSHQLTQTSLWQLLRRDLSLVKRRWLDFSEIAK